MRKQRIEQETTITFNAEEDFALVGTCNPVTLRKMAKLSPEVHRKDGDWITYKVPKSWIKVRPTRVVSESQRKSSSDRLRKINSLRRNPTATAGNPESN